uniref:ADP-ribosylation factor-like protein 2 n=1 Tax=Rhabditophanes sp. KR3021 TaxID=114890 RepID=A0AC35UEX2_9BILA
MGLLTLLKKYKKKEKEMRILLLGLDNSGKTTVMKKFMGEDTDTISPTLGFGIETFKYQGLTLNFWDVGGQKSLRPYWKGYFSDADGIIWVVDSSDVDRLEDCSKELMSLLQEDHLSHSSLLVLANKSDLPSASSAEEIEESLGLKDLRTHKYGIYRTSAKTGDNLLDAIEWLCKDIGARIYVHA